MILRTLQSLKFDNLKSVNVIFKETRLVLALLVFTASPLYSATKASFLIVEHPEAFVIYNRYQQLLTDAEKQAFVPYTPFRILDEKGTLGDGFTPCLKGEADGQVVFLLRDEGGALSGENLAGRISYFRNVILIDDTIESVSMRLVVADPTRSQASTISAGSVIHRVFSAGGQTYVKVAGVHEQFGWVDFRRTAVGRDWKAVEEIRLSRSEQLRKVLPQISVKLHEVNAKLAELCNRLGLAIARPPQWKAEAGNAHLICSLDSEIPVGIFSRSSVLLGKSLETILLGTNLRIDSSPGRIEIR